MYILGSPSMQAPKCTRELHGSIIHDRLQLKQTKKRFLKGRQMNKLWFNYTIKCYITAKMSINKGKPHKPCRMKKASCRRIYINYIINKKIQNYTLNNMLFRNIYLWTRVMLQSKILKTQRNLSSVGEC